MIHIQQFIERLQGFDARGQKDFVMSMKDAKNLHSDITRLLMALEQARNNKESTQETVVRVQMDGGSY